MGRFAIIVVIALSLTFGYFVINKKSNETYAVKQTINIYNRRKAQNLANSYASLYLNSLHSDTTWTPDEINWDSANLNMAGVSHKHSLDSNTEIKVNKQNYIGSNYLDVGEIQITAIADVQGIVCSTLVSDRQIPYSYYGWFVDNWQYYLGSGERITGPFHTNNGGFGIYGPGGPVVDGNMTLGGSIYTYNINEQNWRNDPTKFQGDWIYEGAPKIPFDEDNVWLQSDSENDAFDLDNVFPSHSGDLHIAMLDDGRISVSKNAIDPGESNVDILANNHPNDVKIFDIDTLAVNNGNVILSKNHNLRLRGELKGQLTIATENNVYIDDDITYENDPRNDDEAGEVPSEDLLAIMSKSNVYVSTDPIYYPYENGGSGDTETPHMEDEWDNDTMNEDIPNSSPDGEPDGAAIFGSIYAWGTMKPEGGYSQGQAFGDFYTYGGRIQADVSPTWSSHWNSHGYQGFKEKIIYDERLRRMSPHGMPWTNNRRIYKWKETA